MEKPNSNSTASSPPPAELLSRARAALFGGDNAQALALYHQLADRGHAEALDCIGACYQQGWGVAVDWAAAKYWYERAGTVGYGFGYVNIAQLYERGGPGLAADDAVARSWYEKAAAAGDEGSHWELGRFYAEGKGGLAPDFAAARKCYEQAGGRGYREIGRLYREGRLGVPDFATAKAWFLRAGDADYPLAYEDIGDLYRDGGPGLAANWAEAVVWYDHIDSYLQIGDLWRDGGPGLARDWAKAKGWYMEAIHAGDDDGYGRLGQLYETGGPGLPRDLVQAEAYYRQARDWLDDDQWRQAADRVAAARAAAESGDND